MSDAMMTDKPNTDLTFEEGLRRLDEIVRMLEGGELSLAQGMALYKEGALQARSCREQLEQAKIELEIWQDGGTTQIDGPD